MPLTNFRRASRIAEASTSDILRNEAIQDYGFNVVGGTIVDTLNPVAVHQMIRDANTMWIKNPLANSIIELFLDFLVGDGITYKADDSDVQKVLDDFWNDTDNDWENKGIDRFRDLSLNGELIIVPEVSASGHVKIHTVFPDFVTGVLRDPNGDYIRAIKTNIEGKENLPIIKYSELTKSYTGDVFFYQINKSTFGSRGTSDLFIIRDWLKLYDKSLFSTMERMGLIMSFVWDITIKGANEEQLREKYRQVVKNPPQPGGFRVHNEQEVWDEKTPQLGGRDFEEMFKLLKSQVIGGSRQPEHYFGMGGDVNLATAVEMKTPYFMKVKRRQRLVKKILTDQFDYCIWAAKSKGTLSPTANPKYAISIPDPDKGVVNSMSDTILKISNALSILETAGYIDTKTAHAMVKMIFGQVGVDATQDMENQEPMYNAAAKAVQAIKQAPKQ